MAAAPELYVQRIKNDKSNKKTGSKIFADSEKPALLPRAIFYNHGGYLWK